MGVRSSDSAVSGWCAVVAVGGPVQMGGRRGLYVCLQFVCAEVWCGV